MVVEGTMKINGEVNMVHYVSFLPHGTATTTLRSGSTMVQVRDRQLTRCRTRGHGYSTLYAIKEARVKREAACVVTAPQQSLENDARLGGISGGVKITGPPLNSKERHR